MRELIEEHMNRRPSPYPKLLMALGDERRDARITPEAFDLMSLGKEYYEAALRLLDDAPEAPKVDGVVMPILFLYRHFIELALKAILIGLGDHLHERAGAAYQVYAMHNLARLLNKVRERHAQAKASLDTFGTIDLPSDQAQRFIEELNTIDPESMGFRYPFRKTDKMLPAAALEPVLVDTLWVNLDALRAGMLHVFKELTWYADMVGISTSLYRDYLAEMPGY
jgi:hypothetical protein